jgi:magnesium transporter
MAIPKIKKPEATPVGEESRQLNVESLTWGELTWVNIEQPTERGIEYLAQNYSFNQLDLEDCLSRRQRPKIDEYEDYLFVVLHFPKWYKDVQIARPSQVAIFIGRNYVVTVHSGELTPLVKLFELCKDKDDVRERNMGKGSVFLAYRIIDLLVDYCFPIMDKILSQMESVEDKVFDEHIEASHELAVVRRDVIAQRRIIWPLRTVIGELEIKLQKFTTTDMSVYFGDLSDHINKIWDTLDECKEVIEVFKDTDYVLSTERINRVMRILTIFSSIVLPFIVISSIYGMNIHLPGGLTSGNRLSFILLMVLMALIAGGMLYFFRRKRWI